MPQNTKKETIEKRLSRLRKSLKKIKEIENYFKNFLIF